MRDDASHLPLTRLARLADKDRATLEKYGVETVQQFYALASAPELVDAVCKALQLNQGAMDALRGEAASLLTEDERARVARFQSPSLKGMGALPDRPRSSRPQGKQS